MLADAWTVADKIVFLGLTAYLISKVVVSSLKLQV